MRDYIRKRVVDVSQYILKTNATVRQAASVFGVSKSTIHKDVTERLPRINKELSRQVKEVLELNKSERHIRAARRARSTVRVRKHPKIQRKGTGIAPALSNTCKVIRRGAGRCWTGYWN